MKTTIEKSEKFLKENGLDVIFSGSSDSNGISIYFKINDLKLRFSDHTTTNKDRMFNEFHFRLKNENNSELLNNSIDFMNNQTILSIKKELGDTSISYGKREMLMPSGRFLTAFGFTQN